MARNLERKIGTVTRDKRHRDSKLDKGQGNMNRIAEERAGNTVKDSNEGETKERRE